MLNYIDQYFTGLSPRNCLLVTLACSLVLGVVDYLLGPELSFSVFYTVPIMLASWYGGLRVGLTVAMVSAIIWLCADLAAGSQYSSLLIPLWNTLVRLAFFLIILRLLLIVHEKLQFEASLADTDPLTGLANRRFFEEQLAREYARGHRYPEPLTIAYIDLDNFKHVNDTMGHDVGDELLKSVADTLSKSIRAADFAARLGGDEFSILYPHLDKLAAPPVLEKLPLELQAIMRARNWPVTFSIGVVTFTELMESSRDMIKYVDDLMYEVKKSGKNNLRHVSWPE